MSNVIQNEHIPQYDAFISYRHKELDTAVAKAIHKQLETYRIPLHLKKIANKAKMGKIFRDQDELPLMADLGEGIREALRNSEWLIVVCSPDLPKSKWCMAEIDYFIELGRRSNILTVLVAGEPVESFPEQLRFVVGADGKMVEQEPLAANVRVKNNVISRAVRKMKKEKLRLLAPMLGVGYDDLRRRQRERFLHTAATISAIGLAFFAVLATYVWRQNVLLEQQKNVSMTSQSLFLANLSGQKLAEGDTSIATLLALEGLPKNLDNPERPHVSEAETALRQSLLQTSSDDFSITMSNQSNYGEYSDRIFTQDGRVLFCKPGKVKEYSIITGEHLRSFEAKDDCYAYSIDGGYLLIGNTTIKMLEDSEESQVVSTVELYARDDTMVSSMEIKDVYVDKLGFIPSTSGKIRLWIRGSNSLEVYRFNPISKALEIEFSFPKLSWINLSSMEIEISISTIVWRPDGENVIVSLSHAPEGMTGSIILWDTKNWEQIRTLPLDVHTMEWSSDGTRLVFFTVRDGIQVWDTQLWEPVATLELPEDYRRESIYKNSYLPSLSPDGSKLALLSEEDAAIHIMDCGNGSEICTISDAPSLIQNFSWNADSSQLVCVTLFGEAPVYDASNGVVVKDVGNPQKTVKDAVFLPQISDKLALLQYNVPRTDLSEEERKILEEMDMDNLSIKDMSTMMSIAGKQVSSAPENAVLEFVIWEKNVNKNFVAFEDASIKIVDIDFTADGTALILTVWAGENESLINVVLFVTQQIVLDITTGKTAKNLPEGTIALQYSATTRYAVVANSNKPNERSIFDTEEKTAVSITFSQPPDEEEFWKLRDAVAQFSPDETKVRLLDSIFDTTTGEELHQLPSAYYTQFYNHSQFEWAPDSQRFAYSSGNQPASLYDINKKEVLLHLSGDTKSYPTALSFSPDGSKLAVSTSVVSVLDVSSGTVIATLEPACAIGFDVDWTADGTKLLIRHRYDGNVYQFSTNDWKLASTLPPCEGFSLSADGKMLLTNAGTIYELETGKNILTDRSEWVSSFAPTGLRYAIVASEGVLIRDIQPLAEIVADSRERLGGRELTTQERQQYFLE